VSLIGGIEASISIALIGEVRNAAHMRCRAWFCVRSRSFTWVFLPVHHAAHA